MAVSMGVQEVVSRRGGVPNRDAEGYDFIGGDLEDGWVVEENVIGSEEDNDLRGQGAPRACGMLVGVGRGRKEPQS